MIQPVIDWRNICANNTDANTAVTVKTLSCYYAEVLMTMATDGLIEHGVEVTPSAVKSIALELARSEKFSLREHVSIEKSSIEIVTDTPSTLNDHAYYAIDLFARASNALNGKCGTIYFGKPKYIACDHVSTLINRLDLV